INYAFFWGWREKGEGFKVRYSLSCLIIISVIIAFGALIIELNRDSVGYRSAAKPQPSYLGCSVFVRNVNAVHLFERLCQLSKLLLQFPDSVSLLAPLFHS